MVMIKANDGAAWDKIRNLTLPKKGKMLGGVCTAFGEATPLPTWLWRLAFCIAMFVWGAGLVAYIVFMICIPDERKKGKVTEKREIHGGRLKDMGEN